MGYIIAVKGNTTTESDNAGEHSKNEDSNQFKMKNKMKTDKLFQVRLVTQNDPSRPAFEQVEFIQAFDWAHAHRVAARLFPDVARLGRIWVKECE